MPGTIFGLPFDEELFLQMYAEAPDPYLTAMIDSGAVVSDPVIAGMIQNNGNIYTIPFYDVLDGDDQNYDGQISRYPKPAEDSRPAWYTAVQKGFLPATLRPSFPAPIQWATS